MRQKEPLRTLNEREERELQRVVKASSERVDVVKRAQALLAVRAGKAYTEAAREAGMKSGDSVSQLVGRFNQRGLGALLIVPGRGRKQTYTQEQRALRRSDLPQIARETIRLTLHECGYSYQRTRTWVRTGYALRVRKAGTVTTYDEQTRGAKKTDRAGV
jgi:transposase